MSCAYCMNIDACVVCGKGITAAAFEPRPCKPNDGTKPGTRHILRDRVSGKQETFEWTGKSWSTPGTGWGTKWSLMDALGWRYVGPVTDGVDVPQPGQEKKHG